MPHALGAVRTSSAATPVACDAEGSPDEALQKLPMRVRMSGRAESRAKVLLRQIVACVFLMSRSAHPN